MQSINPSKTVNRRGRFYAVMGVLATLGGFIGAALGILFFALPLLGDSLSTPAGICLNVLGIPIALAGIAMVFRGLTLQKDNPIAYDVGEVLKRTSLNDDARYTYIRNISRRGLGYIDAVLIGPPGVLVFRVVDFKGTWINERVEWRVRNRKGELRGAPNNPSRECARDVYALRDFLKKKNLEKIPVYGIVVFTADPATVELRADAPVMPVAEKHTLFQIMQMTYLQEERINSPMIRAAVNAIIE